MTGAVVGVMALVAGCGYVAAVRHLESTPAAYGWTFDVNGGGGSDVEEALKLRDKVLQNPVVGDVALTRVVGHVLIGGTSMVAYGFEPVRGAIDPTVIDGRPPRSSDEIVLATKTSSQLHRGVGDTVTARGDDGSSVRLRVVGLGLLPTIESDRIASGAAMTREGLERLDTSEGYLEVIYRLAPGVDRAKAIEGLNLAETGGTLASPPGDVSNLGLVRAYPLWLAGFLGLLALFAVLHALLTSVQQRAQQIGVLRALGFTRRQVAGAVSAQATTLAIPGVLVGIPLGLAAARLTWSLTARRLGVDQRVPHPIAVVALVLAAAVVAVIAVGAVSGWRAARAEAAQALARP
jgi:hypothetical protein